MLLCEVVSIVGGVRQTPSDAVCFLRLAMQSALGPTHGILALRAFSKLKLCQHAQILPVPVSAFSNSGLTSAPRRPQASQVKRLKF